MYGVVGREHRREEGGEHEQEVEEGWATVRGIHLGGWGLLGEGGGGGSAGDGGYEGSIQCWEWQPCL